MNPGAALVIGAGSGLGAATAKAFVDSGRAVAVADLDEAAAKRIAISISDNGEAIALGCDVTSSESVETAVAAAADRFGGLGVLVNCAGHARSDSAATLPDREWQHMIDVHLAGTFRACRAAYPHLARSGGSIINISSVAARRGLAYRAAYCAAKAGIEGLTRALAAEWADDGIRVNAVAPGWVRTKLVTDAISDGRVDPSRLASISPLHRLGEPPEVAAAVRFLADNSAGFITGTVIAVDGGTLSWLDV